MVRAASSGPEPKPGVFLFAGRGEQAGLARRTEKGKGLECIASESWVRVIGVKVRGSLKVGHSITPVGSLKEVVKIP